jgi:TadE-like protein
MPMRRSSSFLCREAERGNAVIEFTLLLPWLMLLFTAVFDFGFYAYALISVENAARVAALHGAANAGAAGDQAGACALAVEEIRGLPNIGAGFSSDCTSDPLTVTALYCDGSTPCSTGTDSADGGPAAIVTVTYQMPPLFRVPLYGLTRISRSAEMRLRDVSQ